MPKICLGTVQFGMEYGITNVSGQIKKEEAKLILSKAYSNNIEFIDTAQSYGNSQITEYGRAHTRTRNTTPSAPWARLCAPSTGRRPSRRGPVSRVWVGGTQGGRCVCVLGCAGP